MHGTNTKAIGRVVSELKTSLRNVRAWYGTLLAHLVRTFKQRTNVPYSYLYSKRTVLLTKIKAYRTLFTYRTTMLAIKPDAISWFYKYTFTFLSNYFLNFFVMSTYTVQMQNRT